MKLRKELYFGFTLMAIIVMAALYMLVSVPVRAHAGNGGAGARAEYDAAMAMIGPKLRAVMR